MKFQTIERAALWCVGFLVWLASWEAAAQGLEFHSLKFFGHDEIQGEGADFTTEFSIAEARYISAQLALKKSESGKAKPGELTMGLYDFENKLVSVKQCRVEMQAGWEYAWVSQRFGWPEAGRWAVGTYRVKAWLGETKIAEEAFYLNDSELGGSAATGGVELGKVEFFEGGGFFRPGPAEEAMRTFPRSGVRRIYWVVRGKNLLRGKRAQRPDVVGYFYRPDGTLLGAAANRFLIAPEMEDAVLVEGLGWAEAGKWKPGTYRFELEQDNRLVTESSFEISDPFLKPRLDPHVVHYGILGCGVFNGGTEDPGDEIGRKYVEGFEGGEIDVLWSELVVVNNPNHRKPHSHQLEWKCVGPGGVVLGEAQRELTIQPEWKTARARAAFSLAEAGGWVVGAYKVVLSIDGRLERVIRFEVR